MRCSSFALIACLAVGCVQVPKVASKGEMQGVALPMAGRELQAKAEVDPMAETAAEAKVRLALEGKVLEAVKFNGDSLEVVLNHIRDAAKVNMAVQWGAIEQAGVKRDRAVSQDLKDASTSVALKTVLEQASSDLEGDNRLGYAIEDGIVKVATRRELMRNTVEKTYDIRDLLVYVPNFTDAPCFTLSNAQGGGGGGASIFFADTAAPEVPDQNKLVEDLITRIKEHVGTKSEWDDNLSIMTCHQGQLLVKTTRGNHGALATLLEKFRRQKFLTIALQARVLRMSPAVLEKISAQTRGTLELDAAGVQALMARATEKDSGIHVLASARQRCASGQRTYVLGGTQKAFIADVSVPLPEGKKTTETIDTTENKDGKTIKKSTTTTEAADMKTPASLRATVSTVQGGLVVDTEVTASADHRQVATTVRANFADVSGMRLVAVPGNAQVEAPELAELQWRTTTPIPNGGAVLLTASAPVKAGENAMETVLLLQATVVEAK